VKTKGLVLCVAIVLLIALADICPASDNVELTSAVEQALATTLDRDISLQDSSVEPVAFLSHSRSKRRNPFCYANAEMLFLDVNADSGGRITLSFDDTDTAGTEISFNSGTGVEDLTLSPRLTLGRQFSEKWGVAARYFHLEDTDTLVPPRLTPGTTPLTTFGTYTEFDTAEMYSLDLEAVRSFNPGKTKIAATFGARHAALDVDTLLHAFGTITTGNFANLVLANGCAFDGTGITSELSLRRQIGDSPVSLFVSGRGSKMWGHTDSFGRSAGAVANSPDPPLVGAATVTRNNAESDLIVLEAQAGVQLELALRQFPATAIFRIAGEYQNWDINGPPTGGAGFGGTLGDLTTSSFASAGLGDTELIGGSVAAGFTW